MGREMRRVPADWHHPIDWKTRRFRPLYEGPWEEQAAAWDRAKATFDRGEGTDGSPLPPSAKGCPFDDWHGSRPRQEDYMPSWPESEKTHCQMYETTSEGTPISPVLESPEALARWCADNGVSAFADMLVLPGDYTAAVLVGALNAVRAHRERDRWYPEFQACLEQPSMGGVTTLAASLERRADHHDRVMVDAASGNYRARVLINRVGRRVAKRWIVREARFCRARDRRARDRGDHFEGRAAARLLTDYRPHPTT